jgi:hypothetical protein
MIQNTRLRGVMRDYIFRDGMIYIRMSEEISATHLWQPREDLNYLICTNCGAAKSWHGKWYSTDLSCDEMIIKDIIE